MSAAQQATVAGGAAGRSLELAAGMSLSGGEEEWMGGEELEGAIATLFEAFDKDGDGVSADTRPRSLTL